MMTSPSRKPGKKDGPFRPGKLHVAIAGLILALAGLGYYLHVQGRVSTDDAFVDGHIYAITPRVQGYVDLVTVEDNQLVKAGDVLVELDPTDFQVALAQAKADLAAAENSFAALNLGVPLELTQTSSRVVGAKAQLESLLKNLDQLRKQRDAAQDVAAQAKAEDEKARLDLGRYLTLRAGDVVAQGDLDLVQTKARTAQAAWAGAKAQAEAAGHALAGSEAQIARLTAEIRLAETGEDTAEIKSKDAQAQAARADLARERLRQAQLNLGYTKILAPVTGHVTKKRVEPGQLVAAGQPLLAVVPLNHTEQWITANYKETQLTDVKPGQKASVRIDAYPDLEIEGTVASIMAGTGAAFSLFPPENASGNYVKVVQRIPVKIVFTTEARDIPPLRIGMSAVPVIYTR
jgi:membrane fusion protein, multidrug efflux system